MILSPELRELYGAFVALAQVSGGSVLFQKLAALCARLILLLPSPAIVTGDSSILVPFSFLTPSPLALGPLVVGQAVNRCEMLIVTAFDDPAASAQLGTASAPAALLSAADIDLSAPGSWGSLGLFVPSVPELLQLSLSPGASAQGAGFVFVQFHNP